MPRGIIDELERQKEMGTPKQMIEAKLGRSGFVLTFETDETVGYSAGSKAEYYEPSASIWSSGPLSTNWLKGGC